MPKEEEEGSKEEPESVETEGLGEVPVAVNKTALMEVSFLYTTLNI